MGGHRVLAAIVAMLVLPVAAAAAECPAPGGQPPARSGAQDFDFELGDWTVFHRTQPADPAAPAVEFKGEARVWALLGGPGNVEDNIFHRPTGDTRGVALRAYDRKARQWAIWWIDSRDPHGALDPPMKGWFKGGVGCFYSDGVLGGRPVRTRFIWSEITPTSAKWEQALSYDAGKTWATNWVMRFTRVDARR